jgi:diaminopimelate epimerase
VGALGNQSFVKMNGIGNEIVVVDLRARAVAIAPEEARAAAAPEGAPYDQLMALYPPRTPGTDAFIRIYNNDGSEAGACGNGMRCVADLVSKESGKTALTFETIAGILIAGKAPTACSRWTWVRRASSGTRYRSPKNSATPAPSNCRSDRSTSRCCIRPRW